MAQDSDNEMNASFSKLNVNAMVFVPSFFSPQADSPAEINAETSPDNIGK